MTRSVTRSPALAVDGGTPVRRHPWPVWPHFEPDERAAADEVLASGRVNYWTGEQGRSFEREFAAWAGVSHAVAVANGTVALEIALRAVGVGPGAEVIVPSATFIATAGAVASLGAVPVVVDVDPLTRCLTAGPVAAALTDLTAAVIVVHLGGFPVDMAQIMVMARSHGLRVVEDCAQAHGAQRDGRRVGTSGDVAAWSFCQDKIMTTAGEGGAITTDDPGVWRRCWEYKDHGKNHDLVGDPSPPAGFRWLHDSFGTNARMTEVQAAVGRRQLRKVDDWVSTRQTHAARLTSELAGLAALRTPAVGPGEGHAFYRYQLQVDPAGLRPGWDRDRLVAAIVAEGVPAAHGGCSEIGRERAFGVAGLAQRTLPHAAGLSRSSMTLPLHHRMTATDVDDVVAAVRKVLCVASHE